MKKFWIVVVTLALIASACGGVKAGTEVPTVSATQVPQVPSKPTKEPTKVGPTVRPTTEVVVEETAVVPTVIVQEFENMEVEYYVGATDQMRNWVFLKPEPSKWPGFPNVDNPQVSFEAKDGLEYGMDEHQFCQQDQTCDVSVPAMHYRIISGDYDLGFDQCTGSVGGQGCAIMVVNVGDVTAVFRSIMIDLGFNVMGRYWNGEELPTAIWAGLSHVGNNMLNMNSTLNPARIQNAGANCSVPEGCKTVRLAFVITSGNEVLVKGVTNISK